MRNLQQTDPADATIAKLGEVSLKSNLTNKGKEWTDRLDLTCPYFTTDQLIRYGATFWKPVIPERGYRLVEDHERVGLKPKGCMFMDKAGDWYDTWNDSSWVDDCTYAVPIKQVVAVACGVDYNSEWHMAKFQTPDIRDRAVEKANRGGRYEDSDRVKYRNLQRAAILRVGP